MSRKKKQKPDRTQEEKALSLEGEEKPGKAESFEEKKPGLVEPSEEKKPETDIREIQRQWQLDHIKAVEAEREAERKKAEEEAERAEYEKKRQELDGMLAEAARKPADTEFDIKLTYGDMYRFDLYNTFHSSSGILSLVGAALVTFVAIFTAGQIGLIYTVIYAICAAIFVIYYPLLLIFQSRAEIDRSTILSNPLHYTILDSGLDIISHAVELDNEVVLDWQDIMKVVETGKAFYIYTGKTTAYIIPKEQISAHVAKVRRELLAWKS